MGLFNKENIQTPESVELEFTLAGIGNRAYALFIDYCIFWFSIALIVTISIFLLAKAPSLGLSDNWLIAIAFLIYFAVYVGYFVYFETTWQGQSPGKRIAKIRVISANGQTISLSQAALRALMRTIDDTLFLGAFMIIFSKKEKRLGDWLAGTIVIQEEQNITNLQIKTSAQTEEVALILEYDADISRLSVEDFILIRQYLQRRNAMLMKAQHDLARQIGYSIKDKIGLTDIPENVTANIFLEAVYVSYQRKYSA